MRLSELEKKAKGLGIKDTWKYSKSDLIRTIQQKEGNFSCFSTAKSGSCSQMVCCWREDCLR